MEDRIPVFVHSEVSEPMRRVIRSDGALYLLLLLGAVGCILLSRWLAVRFGVLRLFVQAVLYAALLGAGYAVYRFRLVSYRYTLTDVDLTVHRLVGRKSALLADVPLDALLSVGADGEGVSDGSTYVGRRRDAFCVRYAKDGRVRALYLSASAELRALLTEKIHAT